MSGKSFKFLSKLRQVTAIGLSSNNQTDVHGFPGIMNEVMGRRLSHAQSAAESTNKVGP